MTVRFAHDSKVTIKIKLYVTVSDEGNRSIIIFIVSLLTLIIVIKVKNN